MARQSLACIHLKFDLEFDLGYPSQDPNVAGAMPMAFPRVPYVYSNTLPLRIPNAHTDYKSIPLTTCHRYKTR